MVAKTFVCYVINVKSMNTNCKRGAIMKINKIVTGIISCLILTGCNQTAHNETLTIYIPEHSETWIDSDKVIDNRINTLNAILKEKGKKYSIEVKTVENNMADKDMLSAQKTMLEELSKDKADIVYFDSNQPLYEYFKVLNEDFEKENGKKLLQEIPEHLLEANKIKNNIYYIPKVSIPYQQLYAVFDDDFYETYKNEITSNIKDPVALLNALIDSYQAEKNEILMDGKPLTCFTILASDYIQIKGTPLCINEKGKVMNPLDDKRFMEVYQLLVEADLKGYTGRDFTEKEWDTFYQKGKTGLEYSNSYLSKDSYGTNDTTRKEIALSDSTYPVRTSGYGILKTSEHADNAFDFLCEINSDQQLSNLLIYGEKPELNVVGNVVTDKNYFEGLFMGSLGNDMITTPQVDQKTDKKNIVFELDRQTNDESLKPNILDLSNVIEKIDKINNIWNDFDSITSNFKVYDHKKVTMDEVLQMFSDENKKLKEAGIDDVIVELQKQVDDFY